MKNYNFDSKSAFFLILSLLFGAFFSSCEKKEKASYSQVSEVFSFLETKPDSHQLDSLYLKVMKWQEDSSQIQLLSKIYSATIRNKPIRYDILDTIIEKAERLNDIRELAQSYDRKGLNFRHQLQYQESIDWHNKALLQYKKTKDTLGTIKCLNNLGVSYRRMNLENKAINFYIDALKLSRAMRHQKSIAVALNGIGNVFVNIEQYEKALPYFKEAYLIEKANDNKKGMNYDLSNIGEVFMYQEQYDSALYYYHKALELAAQVKYQDNEAVIFNCIGQLYHKKGDYSLSNEYMEKALPKLLEFNGQRYASNSLIYMGLNNLRLGHLQKAQAFIQEGLNIALQIKSPENVMLGYEALSNLYKEKQNFELSLKNYQSYIVLRDSINAEETKRNIVALESIYENERKDNQIKNYEYQVSLQKSQNLTQLVVIIFLLILISTLIVLSRLKRRNNLLILEQMRNDIQEYIQRLEELENKPNQENEQEIFNKNVEEYGLSEREIDVLLLISKGLKNDEIADRLFLSVSTVKTHTRNIFIKLDVRNRIEATRKAQSI